jgi:hypothetical protein
MKYTVFKVILHEYSFLGTIAVLKFAHIVPLLLAID